MNDVRSTTLTAEEAWYVTSRWQQLDGEFRANRLRIACVVIFYLVHLVQHYRPFGLWEIKGSADGTFHIAATLIAMAWLMMAMAVDLCLRQRLFPLWLPYATTLNDLILLTSVIALGGGQQSPLVLGYALVLCLVSLRLSLPLVRMATAGALIGYLFLMLVGVWPELIAGRQVPSLPPYAQFMSLVAIALTGIVLGQSIRRLRHLAEYYARRRGAERQADSRFVNESESKDTEGRADG